MRTQHILLPLPRHVLKGNIGDGRRREVPPSQAHCPSQRGTDIDMDGLLQPPRGRGDKRQVKDLAAHIPASNGRGKGTAPMVVDPLAKLSGSLVKAQPLGLPLDHQLPQYQLVPQQGRHLPRYPLHPGPLPS